MVKARGDEIWPRRFIDSHEYQRRFDQFLTKHVRVDLKRGAVPWFCLLGRPF